MVIRDSFKLKKDVFLNHFEMIGDHPINKDLPPIYKVKNDVRLGRIIIIRGEYLSIDVVDYESEVKLNDIETIEYNSIGVKHAIMTVFREVKLYFKFEVMPKLIDLKYDILKKIAIWRA